MSASPEFARFSPTIYADVLGSPQVIRGNIRAMWPAMPRIAGPAYPVQCPPGDNLMLHAAIYRAAPGDIIVVQAGDCDYALSGGNVCMTAQQRGITGFVCAGVIRDVAEVRAAKFPVFAQGVVPVPGNKQALGLLNQPIWCGGVTVHPGDIVIADEDGIVVIPVEQSETIWIQAQRRAMQENQQALADWQASHRAKIDRTLQDLGFTE
ncbi:MAG: RraA family protein [Leptolyngbyaceae cyanobacterium]